MTRDIMEKRAGGLVDPLNIIECNRNGALSSYLSEQLNDSIEKSGPVSRVGHRADFREQHSKVCRYFFPRPGARDRSQNIEPNSVGTSRFRFKGSGAPGAGACGSDTFGHIIQKMAFA